MIPILQYFNLVKAKFRRTSRAARLVAALILVLTLTGSSIGLKRWLARRARETLHRQKLLRRNSGLRSKDGARILVIPYRNGTAKVTIYGTKSTTFDAHRRLFLAPPKATGLDELQAPSISGVPHAHGKPGLNLAFLHQYLSLLNIMIPRWNSKESGLLLSQGIFLALRTWLSLVVARLDGEIVRDLVAGNGKGFLLGILKWCGIGGTLPILSSSMEHAIDKANETR